MPGLLKVGFTDREPHLRAQELGGTGLPFPYRVVHSVQVENGRLVERAAHACLREHNVGKEWFRCSFETACAAIEHAHAAYSMDAGILAGSPLVPGHPLEPFFNHDGPPIAVIVSELSRGEAVDEDNGSPLPPGHPARGLL